MDTEEFDYNASQSLFSEDELFDASASLFSDDDNEEEFFDPSESLFSDYTPNDDDNAEKEVPLFDSSQSLFSDDEQFGAGEPSESDEELLYTLDLQRERLIRKFNVLGKEYRLTVLPFHHLSYLQAVQRLHEIFHSKCNCLLMLKLLLLSMYLQFK